MKIRFVRSRPMELFFKDPSSEKARGIFFEAGLSLEGPLDPLSGMVLNLVHVDHLLEVLRQKLETKTWDDVSQALDFFGAEAQALSKGQFHLVSLKNSEAEWRRSSSGEIQEVRSQKEWLLEGDRLREQVFSESRSQGRVVEERRSRPHGSVGLRRSE